MMDNWVINFMILAGGIMTFICFGISLFSSILSHKYDKLLHCKKPLKKSSILPIRLKGSLINVHLMNESESEELASEIKKMYTESEELNFEIENEKIEINELIREIERLQIEIDKMADKELETEKERLRRRLEDAAAIIKGLTMKMGGMVFKVKNVKLKKKELRTKGKISRE